MRQQKNDFSIEFLNALMSSDRDLVNPDCRVSAFYCGIQTFENRQFQKQNPEKFKNSDDSIMQQKLLWDLDECNKPAKMLRIVKPEMETKRVVKIIPLNSGYKANLSGLKNTKSKTQKAGMRNFGSDNLKTPDPGKCTSKPNMCT